MSYRSDLDAAQARAEAAERRAATLQKQVDALKDADSRKEARKAPVVAVPDRFKIAARGDELAISWRWFKPMHLFMLFFVIAWDAFLVNWYSDAPSSSGGWIVFVFPIAHVAVGVGLTYAVVTGLFNRTHVTAGLGRLTVRHGPIPWPGIALSRADVQQLYIAEGDRENDSARWNLCALLENGKQKKLVRGLEEHGQALYLETMLEQHLGIRDVPVASEVPRSLS